MPTDFYVRQYMTNFDTFFNSKLSYFLVAVTAAVTVGAFWFNRRQEDENSTHEKEIM